MSHRPGIRSAQAMTRETSLMDGTPRLTATRHLYLALGWVCVLLALIGAVLPLMPTTIFLLAAAWAFARSSPRLNQWLREHRHFGDTIRAWEEHHAMPRRAKRMAFATLALSYAITAALFGPLSLAAIIGGICMAGVAIYIAQLPVLAEPLGDNP